MIRTGPPLATARGCVLGLMLGDAIGATGGTLLASGPLRATSAGQLACFTVDGLIRAHIGGMHRGLTHPPGMIWYAYNRWAVLQGSAGVKPAYGSNPPAGWLAEVPVLRERRGSAEAADTRPADPAQLTRLAAGDTAQAALLGGVYVAVSFPGRKQVREALLFASSAGAKHSAAVAGALLGAAHGVDALPVDWLSRLELAWVADTLARDYVTQVEHSPSGADYVQATDPYWMSRYGG